MRNVCYQAAYFTNVRDLGAQNMGHLLLFRFAFKAELYLPIFDFATSCEFYLHEVDKRLQIQWYGLLEEDLIYMGKYLKGFNTKMILWAIL